MSLKIEDVNLHKFPCAIKNVYGDLKYIILGPFTKSDLTNGELDEFSFVKAVSFLDDGTVLGSGPVFIRSVIARGHSIERITEEEVAIKLLCGL